MSINVADKYGLDSTGTTDNAHRLAIVASDIATLYASQKPLPRLVFPEGIYSFSAWPDLAYERLEIVAEGDARLMGNIAFNGWLRTPGASEGGINNFSFEGFHVHGSATFQAIHRSKIQVRTFGGPIGLVFCIVTVIEPQSNQGLIVQAWPGQPNLQTTACTIWNPILEGCPIGLDMQSAGSCAVYNGTIESCGTGVHLGGACGNNMFYSVEMEGNGQDVKADSGAHENGFLYCGTGGKLKTNFGLFDSNWAQH